MNNGLIKKSKVLELLNSLDISNKQIRDVYSSIEQVENINAVELPCKLGTVIYKVTTQRDSYDGNEYSLLKCS